MRTSDADILIVPGLSGSGPDHWQTRWEQKLSTARRVEQADWERPIRELWTERVASEVAASARPVILVAHSLGVPTVVHAAGRFAPGAVAGAFLVGLPDVERPDMPSEIDPAFSPLPRDPLPFPSVLVASRDDPYCIYERAEDFAYSWGSAIVDAGQAGHMNAESGYGPWPEGLMRFAGFLKLL
ncbi:RBBP9/YdeN family alpha/beta hydrolase [Enterovirga aerilata]|uniref:Serine hydrolase family protein n=1 Tax=Enterovirga aerilata TaxID=2730920 RepID=A0A849I857_9HYPH|nr:alpha/beta hydrolase [Enterovirga sp. DB1703]NNM72589.1 serine hydrolase family protein [Enterovirga sp. DB1703]